MQLTGDSSYLYSLDQTPINKIVISKYESHECLSDASGCFDRVPVSLCLSVPLSVFVSVSLSVCLSVSLSVTKLSGFVYSAFLDTRLD